MHVPETPIAKEVKGIGLIGKVLSFLVCKIPEGFILSLIGYQYIRTCDSHGEGEYGGEEEAPPLPLLQAVLLAQHLQTVVIKNTPFIHYNDHDSCCRCV